MVRAPRRGKANVIGILLGIVVLVGGLALYMFGPYYLDYMNMKEVVQSSSLAWYANDSKDSAAKKLDQELRSKEIDYITPDDCTIDEVGKLYTVSCYWEVDVYYPFTRYYKSLAFEVTSEADRRGTASVYSSVSSL